MLRLASSSATGLPSRTSLERALELAEPEGIILPFALAPVCELLECQRGHHTAHATLLTTILDVLAGASPQCTRPCASRSAPPNRASCGTSRAT